VPRPIFALGAWTVEQRGPSWYYGDTYREEKGQFRGPYSSIASVTLMIAREMTREILRRQQRLEVSHAAE
jgi:hypothetical protein